MCLSPHYMVVALPTVGMGTVVTVVTGRFLEKRLGLRVAHFPSLQDSYEHGMQSVQEGVGPP